jgi:uncharacterized coiled-coil protein SlyX
MSETDDRVTDLEMKFMDQSQMLEELSDEVALCHRRIDELVRENKSLREMVKTLEPESEESPDE